MYTFKRLFTFLTWNGRMLLFVVSHVIRHILLYICRYSGGITWFNFNNLQVVRQSAPGTNDFDSFHNKNVVKIGAKFFNPVFLLTFKSVIQVKERNINTVCN